MTISLTRMEAVLRGRRAAHRPTTGARPAAVMVLLSGAESSPELLLIRRSSGVRHHKNEIAFPGGVQETTDATLLDTALREVEEEVGVGPAAIEVWGELDPVETSTTGFAISPFTGLLARAAHLAPDPREVADAFFMPLAALADPAAARDETMLTGERLCVRPSYSYNGSIVWGATARILSQLIGIARDERAERNRDH